MLVWSGWGILTVLLFAVGGVGGTGIGVALGGSTTEANPGTAAGMLVASVVIWFVGQRLNRPTEGRRPNQHKLFFIPMQWFGPIGALIAVTAGVIAFS